MPTVVTASAIIAEAKRLIPNKPIKYLFNTHSHFDHSSGLRRFMAEGTTIITHEQNKPVFRKGRRLTSHAESGHSGEIA